MKHRLFIAYFTSIMTLYMSIVYIALADASANCVGILDNSASPTFFISGIDDAVEDATAVIGTTSVSDVEYDSIIELEIPIATLVLIDNSQSIPEHERQKAKDVVKSIISSGNENNQYEIVTFGEDIEKLCDYTDDDTVLNETIDSIETISRDTYIKDILFEVLNQKDLFIEGQISLNRILIISDGIDDNTLGVTSAELLELIGEKRVPITAIGVQNIDNSNNEQLEELFSYARRSSGRSFVLNDYEDFSSIVETMNQDELVKYFTVGIPDDLLDGSKKTVQLSITSNGEEYNVSVDNVRLVQQAKEQNTEEFTQDEYTDIDESEEETVGEFPQPLFMIGNIGVMLWMLVVFVMALLLIVALTVFLILKRAENIKEVNKIEEMNIPVPDFVAPSNVSNPSPEISAQKMDVLPVDSDKTMMMFDYNNQQSSVQSTPVVNQVKLYIDKYVIITDLENSNHTFKHLIKDGSSIVIGRKEQEADIVIDYDKAISGSHCEILLKNEKYFIKDLNSSNGTWLNNARISGEAELSSNQVIKLGRRDFRITFIEE